MPRHPDHDGPIDAQDVGTRPPRTVGPAGALALWGRHALQLSGRSSRSEFWWVVLILGAVLMGLDLLGARAAAQLVALVSAAPFLALLVRRLHHANSSTLWALLVLLPPGWIVLAALALCRSQAAGRRFDAPAADPGRAAAGLRAAAPVLLVAAPAAAAIALRRAELIPDAVASAAMLLILLGATALSLLRSARCRPAAG